MIHSTLGDQDRFICCQVNSNIMLNKFFDDMRLLRSLRLLRLFMFLIAGKSSRNQITSNFSFFEAKEDAEVIEASDVIMSVRSLRLLRFSEPCRSLKSIN